MPILVEWYDPKARIMRCDISDSWDAASFHAAYRSMFDLARKANDKIALIVDIRNADTQSGTAPEFSVVASAFIGVVIFVSEDSESQIAASLTEILREHAPHALFTHAVDLATARKESARLLPRVSTNIYMN